jgi:hypothetical protein
MAIVWGIAYLPSETIRPGWLSMDAARHPPKNLKFNDLKILSTAS